MKKTIIFLFTFILLSSLVSAQPPSQVNINGLEIAFPSFEFGKVNTAFEFPFHVYRISDGLNINSSTSCVLHIYNALGEHLLQSYDSVPSHTYDYEFNINNSVFNQSGWYSFNIYCECTSCSLTNTDLGGHVKHIFEITANGNASQTINPVLLIIGLIFIGLFLTISFLLSDEHLALKLLSFGMAIISLVATANLGLEIAEQNFAYNGIIITLNAFYKIALLFQYLFIAYVVIYYFYTFMLWFNKKVNPK